MLHTPTVPPPLGPWRSGSLWHAAGMPYEFSPRAREVLADVTSFMDDHVYPNEEEFAAEAAACGTGDPPLLDKLKAAARERGLWNLFLPHLSADAPGTKLSNLDYAPVSEQLGKVEFASELLNCSAPDTGNMEILNRYGSERVKQQWLAPLLEGEIRSGFSMTEPDVASSDATNVSLRIERRGDTYVLNGTKWFTSGALRDRCKVLIVMGKTNPGAPKHLQQSMLVVPKDTPGRVDRPSRHRCSATPTSGSAATPRSTTTTSRCPPTTCSARRAAASPSPRPGSVRGGSTTACARSASPSGRSALMIDRAVERFDVRDAGGRQGPDPGLDRRITHRHRHGPRVRAARRQRDGHGGQQGGGEPDRWDQGRRPEHRPAR